MMIIDHFIKQYNKEFDFYLELSRKVATTIEDQLFKRGVKAIVTYRAKRPDRLKDKLDKRNEEKDYKSVDDIFIDIVDLSGVRVALYFPSERDILDEIIHDLFHVEKTKKFPDAAQVPNYEERFSGYWATHYHVKLNEGRDNQRYLDILSEIQVASVLMHAWSEVEHDLVYKPFSEDLSNDESLILNEINGLVLAGEIALERLQKAITERTKGKREITDKYELTNTLVNFIQEQYKGKMKLGDTFILNNYLNANKRITTGDFYRYLELVNPESKQSLTDQLLDMLITYENESPDLKNYFINLNVPERRVSGFESFIRCWVILERAVRAILYDPGSNTKKYFIPDFQLLPARQILNQSETDELLLLREMKTHLLHGIETSTNEYLSNRLVILKKITEKVIKSVSDKPLKSKLNKELVELSAKAT